MSEISARALNRLVGLLNVDLGFGVAEQFRMNVLAIDQCIAVITSESSKPASFRLSAFISKSFSSLDAETVGLGISATNSSMLQT